MTYQFVADCERQVTCKQTNRELINMEKYTKEQREEARKFGEFFTGLMDNHKNCARYYLSETAVMDWFGQTVKGEKSIQEFIMNRLSNCKHNFNSAMPVDKIGFRDSHVVNVTST